MEYTKPELILLGKAESLVLGFQGPGPDPAYSAVTSSIGAAFEFED